MTFLTCFSTELDDDLAPAWVVTDECGALMAWTEMGYSELDGPVPLHEYVETGGFPTRVDAEAAIADVMCYRQTSFA